MTIQCPKCKAENPDTVKFCGECGTQLDPLKDIPAHTMTLETPIQELARGTIFANRYEIIEELGTGGMGFHSILKSFLLLLLFLRKLWPKS